ncbi:MAG TPA: hypothetical protein VNO70_07185 [Blastocatellia bacterium]|nr:hypothetical protein [Blastocatellia bacterium]
MRRKVSLVVIAMFISALVIAAHGCSRSDGDEEMQESYQFDLNDPNIKERLGEDDGYAFAIFYGADIHGSLETCG